ncbi:PAS domain S-box protein [Alicyclobacillus acidiphilus]|uniref:PAS domain S-box protein n=1 Tax=Alicyclobacillus acidiphilus TaxID=182455 RepID=UPI0008299ABB|nr:PAS domain S-box protein [Alicyclobacillus acidiphilus]
MKCTLHRRFGAEYAQVIPVTLWFAISVFAVWNPEPLGPLWRVLYLVGSLVVLYLVLHWLTARPIRFKISQYAPSVPRMDPSELLCRERRLRTLVNSISEPVCFTDGQGRWLDANTAMLRLTGLHMDGYQRKTGKQLMTNCQDKHGQLLLQLSGIQNEDPGKIAHVRHIHREQGTPFVAYDVTKIPIHSNDREVEWAVLFRDATEEYRTIEKLRESEQRYRSLFDHDGDMVVSVDLNGVIQSVNPSCTPILGYQPEELIGRYYADLIAPEYRLGAKERFDRIVRGELLSLFAGLLHKSGRQIEVYEKKIPILVDGRVTGFFWTIRDITSQRLAEELLIKSERLSAIGQMAASIAHEIRNPLTALKGFVQLMLQSREVREPYLVIMQSELERIDLIAGELLVFSKPSAPHMERQNYVSILNEVLDLMDPHAALHNICMSKRIVATEIEINCDKNRLKQVFVNVLKNSIEAMPTGGEIEIEVRVADDKVVTTIRDNGPGIAKDTLEYVGEPFYTTKPSGTGLGIVASRKIIESHLGTLEIDSEEGRGTEVRIEIPL